MAELAASLHGVDLIIRGHAKKRSQVYGDCSDRTIKSFQDLGVPILFAGDRGRVIGKAVILPFEEKGCILTDTTVIHLDRSYQVSNRYTAQVNNFLREEAKRRNIMEIQKNATLDEEGNIEPKYLGMQICGRCHGDILRRFIRTAHFRAYDTIRDQEDKSTCLECHTTGYGERSGYGSEEAQKSGIDLRGVRCQECHGPGSEHSRGGSYIESAVNSCRRCHTPEWSPDFDYQKYLSTICSVMNPDSSTRKSGIH
jgi:hypothetical protein